MGESGYNRQDSSVWHEAQRCSGTTFTALESMDSHIAENRGLSPCGTCCASEWPHEESDEDAEADADEWLDRMEPRETALKLTSRTWNGPEYLCATSEGKLYRWPVGLDKNIAEAEMDQLRHDIEDSYINVEAVEFEETPLADYDNLGWSE